MKPETQRVTTKIARLLQRTPWLIQRARHLGLANLHIPHGEAGIRKVGHRRYVGHLWEEVGELQFRMMLSQGLQPADYLCDIACGSFRAGRYFIEYLEPSHYLGIDKERSLIELGKEHELGAQLLRAKRPELVVDGEFRFDQFSVRANYAIAHSLFTHLPRPSIELCLENLRSWISPRGALMATFFESARAVKNPRDAHDHVRFEYTRDEMRDLALRTGWSFDYRGDWNHPREQMLVRFVADDQPPGFP